MKMSLRYGIPLVLLFVFYGLIQLSFTSLRKMEKAEDQKETTAILEIVTDRFKRYLELPYLVGSLGAEYLSSDIAKTPYEHYALIVQKDNEEFLGFNILDKNGLIIRTYPEGINARALGKVSQMTPELRASLSRGEKQYLSPPFRLFQGQQGFVFYFPIMKSSVLQGWYAVVISGQTFLERFALEDFLRLYDLNIVDEKTGRDYFSTALEPQENGNKVFTRKVNFFGRDLILRTWRKDPHPLHEFPWYFSAIISLILAVGVGLILRLFGERRKVRGQLDNMGVLLRVTSKEALSNLIEIHGEINELNLKDHEKVERLTRDINYLTNLIEQIDLLQTMAHTKEGLTEEQKPFLRLLETQLDNFSDVFVRKGVKPTFERKNFQDLKLRVNEWLFENSVLANVFSHLLIHIERGTELKIDTDVRGNSHFIRFRIKRHPSSGHTARILTRRIAVARKVLQLHDGDLEEELVSPDELVITMRIPG